MHRHTNKKRLRSPAPKLARTRKVLCFLAELSGEYFEIWYDARDFRSALLSGGVEYVRFVKGELAQKKYRQTLSQLQRKKYIQLQRTGNSLRLKLTKRGWVISTTDKIRAAGILPAGDICLVSFDIPETHRGLRSRLRRFLKNCGFQMRQKSLWSTEKDVSRPILRAVKEMGAEEWIHVYVCRQISD